ncbi:nuclear transport factor 2 family protein [Rhizobium esperanzae]|uniref:Putative SnoaL-like aldol condensation-catalyzing enzyme n=1 Tax=Rhizobium esperanzae TaxID=1967781 RepID=A0A7W6R3D7_9HYPH|nr:nuclear transport factor 2 family protein [Rhizobium esperanzae]MBB4235718.1 putative SnoaL-like aldol condensation-catalyzing enzyme [Rhizobium esperanzae]
MRFQSLFALAILAGIAAPSGAFAESAARDLKVEEANRKLVVEFYDKFFNKHDIAAASVIADDYRQHNPQVPDGKQPLISFFTGFFKDNAQSKAEIVRSAADGDLVWLHVHATNGVSDLGEAVIDIFRVKDGKIVEHWDVIQPVPKEAANKNTMF